MALERDIPGRDCVFHSRMTRDGGMDWLDWDRLVGLPALWLDLDPLREGLECS